MGLRSVVNTGSGGASDHGALTGLDDNDHPQYAQFVQDASPTALMVGQLWVDTDATTSVSVAPTKAIRTETTNYTAIASDYVIVFNISANSVLTLVDPTTNSGAVLDVICRYDSTANVTFSEDIDGDSAYTLTPGEVVNIISDGTQYLRNA